MGGNRRQGHLYHIPPSEKMRSQGSQMTSSHLPPITFARSHWSPLSLKSSQSISAQVAAELRTAGKDVPVPITRAVPWPLATLRHQVVVYRVLGLGGSSVFCPWQAGSADGGQHSQQRYAYSAGLPTVPRLREPVVWASLALTQHITLMLERAGTFY